MPAAMGKTIGLDQITDCVRHNANLEATCCQCRRTSVLSSRPLYREFVERRKSINMADCRSRQVTCRPTPRHETFWPAKW